jgi:hypothetical protein
VARIPIGPIIEGAKKVGKFIKDHRKDIVAVGGAVGAGAQTIKELREKKKEEKNTGGKIHHRKERYNHYKTKILVGLDNKDRNKLFQYTLENENFIEQIKNEEKNEFGVKKPVHEKRIKNWNEILIQINDKMYTKDYHEFLKIYNNPNNYNGEYFRGFEGLVEKFKTLVNKGNYDEILKFISVNTNRSIDRVKKDFPNNND